MPNQRNEELDLFNREMLFCSIRYRCCDENLFSDLESFFFFFQKKEEHTAYFETRNITLKTGNIQVDGPSSSPNGSKSFFKIQVFKVDMACNSTCVNEVSNQDRRNSMVFGIAKVDESGIPKCAHHLNLVLALDAIFTRRVSLPLLKETPFSKLSLQDISQIRGHAYKAGIYSQPCYDSTAVQAGCLQELRQLTKRRLHPSTPLHISCFRPVVLMSAIAPWVVTRALFQWLLEDHRTLLSVIPFVADAFISLGNALSFHINSSAPLLLDAFSDILSPKQKQYSMPQSVLHDLFIKILSHTTKNNIVNIDQCLHFVVVPLVKNHQFEFVCELLHRMTSVMIDADGTTHSDLMVNSVREIVIGSCSPFLNGSPSIQRSTDAYYRPSSRDVQNIVTIVESCARYVPQKILQSTFETIGKRLPPMLCIRLVHCVVSPDEFTTKRNEDLSEAIHKLCIAPEQSITHYERILTLSVAGPDSQLNFLFPHQYCELEWRAKLNKTVLWIAAIARQAFVFSDKELSVLFCTRLPILLEAICWKSPEPSIQKIPEGLGATLGGCQLGLQASVAAQYVPSGHARGADIALRLCRASCTAMAGFLEHVPESRTSKCDLVIAATTILLRFLTRQLETSSCEWPGRSFCADIVTMTLLELLRKFGVEISPAESEEAKVKVANVMNVISSFENGHGGTAKVCLAAMSAFQSRLETP